MNAQSTQEFHDDMEDEDARIALISRCDLSARDVEKIDESSFATGESFTQSALLLGFISQTQLEELKSKLRKLRARDGVGVIEHAIRAISSDRQIVVRQGEKLKPGPKLILAHSPDDPRSERIRALRTELLLRNSGGQTNIVPLLSPGAGEGRSQMAAELAISFAQLGQRTLLVDADMRRPQQHVLFGANNLLGLSQALTQREKPNIHPIDGLPHLSLVTSGPLPPNPLELLSDGRFERILSEWRNTYEFIVLDTPPVTMCADALAIASLVGRVLVLSRAEHTTFKETRELLRRVATTQSQILGAVINYF